MRRISYSLILKCKYWVIINNKKENQKNNMIQFMGAICGIGGIFKFSKKFLNSKFNALICQIDILLIGN